MSDKKQYYKLDTIGFVGTQENLPDYLRKEQEKKTGEIIRNWKEQQAVKKASSKKNKTK